MRRRRPVRFGRPHDSSSITGYISGVGAALFLVTAVDEAVRFDGFHVVRTRDVRDLDVAPHAEFIEAALGKRRLSRPAPPRLDLQSFGHMLRQVGRRFPLVTIHRERVDPEVCQIGAVAEVNQDRVILREIDPNGRWHTQRDTYALREITRVDFGGAYEDALHLVGGVSPLAKP